MPELKAILFDLDGTIVDTEKNAAEAVEEAFARWNVKLEPADATYVTGRTWESAFKYLFGKYKIPVSETDAAQSIRRDYRLSIERNLNVVPGAVEAVKDLAGKYRLALVSGSTRTDITWALQTLGILDRFEFVLGEGDYLRSKPAPDPYLRAMGIMQVQPEETAIFEDSAAGIRSAVASGAGHVIAITGTNHFFQDHTIAHHRIVDFTCVTCQWIDELMRRQQK